MNKMFKFTTTKYLKALLICICTFLLIGCTSINVNVSDADNNSKQDEDHSALSDFTKNELVDAGDISESHEDKVRECIGGLDIRYASQFTADYYEDGYVHVVVEGDRDYVLVPEGFEDDNLGIEDAVMIHTPCNNIYLAASSAVDLFASIDALNCIKTISTKATDLSIKEAANLIENGAIKYVGKYSSPDYETILNEGCTVAIESTMINHSPKIKEELEDFDIPVITEHSSYETDPLGRLEWIKLYGLLTGHIDEANAFFDEQEAAVQNVIDNLVDDDSKLRPKVAFFYISSNGYVNVRKPGDYFCRIIDIAGGEYALNNLVPEEENALSTMNIGWEDFYKEALDSDIMIYNGTIDDSVRTLDDFLSKNSLLADFNAVKNGRVYSTNHNVYQESSSVGEIITEMSSILKAEDDSRLVFFNKLN